MQTPQRRTIDIRSSDEALIEAYREGQDALAYSELVRRYQIPIYRILSALLSDPDTSDVEELRALMHRAQHANRVNGAAIESSQLFTSSLLDILRGRVPGERTYTARGRLGVQAESMPLVSV